MKRDRLQLQASLIRRADKVWNEFCELWPSLCRFDCPKIVLNNRMWRTAGQCYQEDRIVYISAKFYDAGYDARMNNIILPHELIHQADFDLYGLSEAKCGHGKMWRKMMLQYGLEDDPYHSMDVTQQGKRK